MKTTIKLSQKPIDSEYDLQEIKKTVKLLRMRCLKHDFIHSVFFMDKFLVNESRRFVFRRLKFGRMNGFPMIFLPTELSLWFFTIKND